MMLHHVQADQRRAEPVLAARYSRFPGWFQEERGGAHEELPVGDHGDPNQRVRTLQKRLTGGKTGLCT